jgi:hypothetical protein
MLLSYLDESGIHGNASPCVIVAGYFGKKGAWRRFEARWEGVLKRFRVPLDEFHALDAIKRQKFFAPWPEDTHAQFLTALGQAVGQSLIHPICYGIYTEDFFKFSLNQRRFLTGATWDPKALRFTTTGNPNRPYFVTFVECLKIVASHTPSGARAQLFFGVDRPIAGYATALFRYIKSTSAGLHADRFGAIGFPLASASPRLQAADLFSYLSYRHMLERKISRDWSSRPSRLLLELLRNRKSPYDTSYRTDLLIRKMISVVPNLPE